MKKYNRANEDPLYWLLSMGFFSFTILCYYLIGLGFTLSWISAILGMIVYRLVFANQRLWK